ncbi:hypothetical protein B566_EDAN017288 [Ephemera danica]|nr:hypothetical protein B566_EDAN017288 [Ephemera danica]
MKHKSAELLVPPSPNELLVMPTPAVSSASSSQQQRKKPHVLPPLADKRKSSDKPAVRVIHCPDVAVGTDGAAAVTPAALRATKYAPLEPIKRQPRPV